MSAIGIDEDHAQHLPNNERDDDEQARHREAQAECKEVWKTLEPKWGGPEVVPLTLCPIVCVLNVH